MTASGPEVRRPVEVGPEFPIAFERPGDEELTWELDDMHWPFALTPLAAEYVRLVGSGMNDRYDWYGSFPQRWRIAVWNGYPYFTLQFDGTPEEFEAVSARWQQVWQDQLDGTGPWWRDEALPELRDLYARIAAVDVEGLTGEALAAAWTDAWDAGHRAWAIHFVAIMCPYQAVEDLADFYEKTIPDAPSSEALTLTQGYGDDLFAVELGSEALAASASAAPAVASALRFGGATREDLQAVDGGPAFVAQLDAFLAEHGHLGQACDDFALSSWVEEPDVYLAELAKRVGRPAVSATRRRERLRAEADALADRLRERLADQAEDLARFERLLTLAREIGPLTEGHNYWIDRMVQSHLRRLATRVGGRLAAQGSIEEPGDVFFLEHPDITAALAAPSDLRTIVAERKAAFARQREIRPPAIVGKPGAAVTVPDRFDGARIESDIANELRGTGASAGVVRGMARVALSPADFDRIQPGDIIVCPSSNPSWVPVFVIAGGLVTNTGGVLSHAAVVAREFGLPAVVGIAGATDQIADGREVEIDGARGIVRML